MSKIKLIICDDHPLIKIGLRNIIKSNKKLELLGEAGNGREAINLIYDTAPDIAILDVDMPVLNGIDTLKLIRAEGLSTRVLFLTMLKDVDVFEEALKFGANGYLLKDHTTEELELAITEIYSGKTYISEKLNEQLVKGKGSILQHKDLKEKIAKLTKTERDIIVLIAGNLSTKEISSKLFVSDSTIKNHRHNIVKKLELEGENNSLLKFAMENAHLM